MWWVSNYIDVDFIIYLELRIFIENINSVLMFEIGDRNSIVILDDESILFW